MWVNNVVGGVFIQTSLSTMSIIDLASKLAILTTMTSGF